MCLRGPCVLLQLPAADRQPRVCLIRACPAHRASGQEVLARRAALQGFTLLAGCPARSLTANFTRLFTTNPRHLELAHKKGLLWTTSATEKRGGSTSTLTVVLQEALKHLCLQRWR